VIPNLVGEPVWEPTLARVVDRFEVQTCDVLLVTGDVLASEEAEGSELLEVLSAECPVTQVIVLVEGSEVDMATEALKAGASHYGRLPMTDEELRLSIEAAYATQPDYGINQLLSDSESADFSDILGESPAMQEAYRQIRLAAAIDVPVLIEGETGTGKDLFAQEIHRQSVRERGPFVAVNLGAIPPELVGSELFGHMKGAFTGAVESREGKFEQSREGTIFLDEIGAIDERVQISLLRLLEENRFTRLGGKRTIPNDARVITATNRPLTELVAEGVFREDLFYRLDVFRITLPPLRDRGGDVRLLAEAFAGRFSKQFGRNVRSIHPGVWPILESQVWNGNVRELKNVIRRAILACSGTELAPENMPQRLRASSSHSPVRSVSIEVGSSLREIERQVIELTLANVNGNRTEAAKLLGVSRRALYNKMHRYGLA